MQVPAALAQARFPAPLLEVLRRLAEAGHRSWLVGGAVRDLLLHRPRQAADYDVATPALPEEVQRLFRRVIPTGVEHGTVTVLAQGEPVEVTTFRGEGAYRDGRRPESVTFLTELEADLARRDFTMNALAYDPLGGEFRDPFGGQADLAAGRVRAVGDPAARFGEDGLRPMRAVRFVAQLGFALDGPTGDAIPAALPVVRKVAAERITDELSRLLVAPHAADGLALLGSTGLLSVALPALAARPEGERAHAGLVVARAPAALAARLAALLHPLGGEGAAAALGALRLSRAVADEAVALIRAFPCMAAGGVGLPAGGPADLRRWLAAVDPRRAEVLLDLASAEGASLASGAAERAAAQVNSLRVAVAQELAASPPLAIRDLALDGRAVAAALGASPGPRVGEALRYLLERVLEAPEENTPERLRAALQGWPGAGPGRV